MVTHVQCLVVGGGPAGLAAAAALATIGADVAIAGATLGQAGPVCAVQADPRTAALFPPAIALLDAVGAGPAQGLPSTQLAGIRIVDAMGGLLRAPEILFEPRELGLASFGANVTQFELGKALLAAIKASDVRVLEGGPVIRLRLDADRAVATLESGQDVSALLVVAADGRHSLCRESAGLTVRRWRYDQSAIATSFDHQRPHHGISTELHRPSGPCTTVPLAGRSSSLVWVERPREALRLEGCSASDFLGELEHHLGGLLGPLSNLRTRRAFPLEGLVAGGLGQNRVALVGEAAHVIPPIGAQGLNLGLRDVATLADCVSAVLRAGADIGSPDCLAAYTGARADDIRRRISAVDLVNTSLTSSFWPLSVARGLSLHVLASVPSIRRRVMVEGIQPPGPLPRLMRGAALGLA